jgi:malate dehydrogenase (oxaloacetate-decarboxylating)(NADP+)
VNVFGGVTMLKHGSSTCIVSPANVFACISLLGKDRMDRLTPEQQRFARDEDNELPMLDVVRKYKPDILVGVTAVGGLFNSELIVEMASHVERPIIFPLSNPTIKAECTAEQAFDWTDGRCIFASGSPFDPVELEDGRTFAPSQCNNSKRTG